MCNLLLRLISQFLEAICAAYTFSKPRREMIVSQSPGSSSWAGLKWGIGKITYFGLKWGKSFKECIAHPSQIFSEYSRTQSAARETSRHSAIMLKYNHF